jgi:hypothetical protein
MEASMEDTFWLDEQVAPQSADPLFQLMLERGEVDEDTDTEDLRLGLRQQAILSAWIEHSHEVEESNDHSEAVARVLQRSVERSTKILRNRISKGQCSFEDALTKLMKLGVDRDESVALLIGE